ncbi:MAG TPA: peptidoglycan DD-metalloendopeptidase family protein [Acidimicrobiales bacterium]|nr:peptidoglycan DD-metalloendopeptidase family protein [Acidimicrobiales bacterium]
MTERASRNAASLRALALVVLAVILGSVAVGLAFPPPGVAQEAPPDDSSTTTEPTTLLQPGETTTTTAPTTTTTAPPPPPANGGNPDDDSGPTEVPQDVVVVPPPEGAVGPDPFADVLAQIAGVTLAEVQKGLKATEQARALAVATTTSLSDGVALLEARIAQLEADKAQAVARLQQARLQLKKRAVAGYMGSPAQPINQILEAADFNDLSRRFELLQSVVEADRARISEYNAAREAVGSELQRLVTDLDAKRSALTVSATVLDGADSQLLAKQIQLAAVRAGSNVVGGGFVFPVGGAHSFSDTFGAPRMFGTSYAHLHQGTDIFAASGTPLLAVERGVLISIGSDVLGGTKLWLVGASGTRYYYAHLSAFAEGVADGKVVSAGDVVGFVGNTGNAATTPAHCHFEVHPNGGPAVNPYPLLKIVDDAQKQLAGGRPVAPTTSTSVRSA